MTSEEEQYLRQELGMTPVVRAAQPFIDEALATQEPARSSLESGRPDVTMDAAMLDLAAFVQEFMERDPAAPTQYLQGRPRHPRLHDLRPRMEAAAMQEELLNVLRHAEPKQVAAVAKHTMADPDHAARIKATSHRIRRAGIARLTPVQLLVLVLAWLVLPTAQAALPPEFKNLIAEEVPVITVAVAITLYLLGERDQRR